MGLVVCGGRLLQEGVYGVGALGLLFGVGLVPLQILLAQLVVSRRCYRIAVRQSVTHNPLLRGAAYVFLPQYELDKDALPASGAFTSIVGTTRYRWSGWAGVRVLQPVIMVLCVFGRGSLCNALYITAAAFLGLLGMVHLVLRPNRILVMNFLASFGLLVNAALVLLGSMLAYDPTNPTLRDVYTRLASAQTALTGMRLLLQLLSFVIMRARRGEWLCTVMPDGSPTAASNGEPNERLPNIKLLRKHSGSTFGGSLENNAPLAAVVFEVLAWQDQTESQPWLTTIQSDDDAVDQAEELLIRRVSSLHSSLSVSNEESSDEEPPEQGRAPSSLSDEQLNHGAQFEEPQLEVRPVVSGEGNAQGGPQQESFEEEILGTMRVVNVARYGAARVFTGAALEAVLADALRCGYPVVHHHHN